MEDNELLNAKSYRDRVSTVDEQGKRKWIYAAQVKGLFFKYRTYFTILYFVAFFAMPFIKVNGLPFLQFNIVDGVFIIFGKVFWPEDFYIIALSLIAFVIFIALFTIIYGRLFCGWACPQTIFLEFVFRPIEWLIEGSPGAQKKLNNGPKNGAYFAKKITKHAIYFIISYLISLTFLSYILGVDALFKMMEEGISAHLSLFAGLLFFALMFYVVFAYVREIVCTTICPYGRLQGVLFDKNTMQIAYDYNRGEPRAKFSKKLPREFGDCIDCHQCVVVCPTGIDIRDGLQMECVGCTACIDACDFMMDKTGLPKGLIRYASENSIADKQPFAFTNRIKAYSVVLVLLLAIIAFFISTNKSISTHISRTAGQIYQMKDSLTVSNLYNTKIINKTPKECKLDFKVENHPFEISVVGDSKIHIGAQSMNSFTFFVMAPLKQLNERKTNLEIGIYLDGEKIDMLETNFIGPIF